MPITSERRNDSDRRWRLEPQEPLERQTPRRRAERRTSVRSIRRVTVVELPDGVVREFHGNLSLQGALFITPSPLISSEVEVRFRVPHRLEEVSILAHVVRMQPAGRATAVHVRFEEMDLQTELALARLLDFEERVASMKRPDA